MRRLLFFAGIAAVVAACTSFGTTNGDTTGTTVPPAADGGRTREAGARVEDGSAVDDGSAAVDASSPPGPSCPGGEVFCDSFDGPALDPTRWRTHVDANNTPDSPPSIVDGQLVSALPADQKDDGARIDGTIPTSLPIKVTFDIQEAEVDDISNNYFIASVSVSDQVLGFYADTNGTFAHVVLTDASATALADFTFAYGLPVTVELAITWGKPGSFSLRTNGNPNKIGVSFNATPANPTLTLGAGRPNGPTGAIHMGYDNVMVTPL